MQTAADEPQRYRRGSRLACGEQVAAPVVAVTEPKARPKAKPAAPKQTGPSELERIEAEIAAREHAVTELEERLAEDWGDAETVAAHRTARDELQALLARWEQLFEQAKA